MKCFSLSLAIVLALTVGVAPNANADTVTFPCGGTATYSVLMPAGVAFDGKKCSGTLILDSSVKILDIFAFQGAKITSIKIPNSVTAIYQDALSSTLLTSVDIPNSVTVIPPYAFAFSPLTTVNIPSSIRSIGSGAFYGTNLSSITIPSSVTSIGSSVFTSTPLSSVTFAEGITFIGNQWFIGVPLTSINIPNSVVSIGTGAFALSKLSNVVIPNSVRSIGSTAFGSITTLTTISLPDNVSISSDTFERSYLLNRIEYCGLITGFPVAPICPPERQAVIDAAKAKAAADKAAAELKAKQEADAKAAAELKAKQEADAKTASELKAKQEAEAKTASELKAKQEAEAKSAAELKAKQEAEAKAAAELKAKQEAAADKAAADKAAADKAAADKAAAEAKASNTALIPPGNVSCSLSSSGVNFGVSLTFTSGNVVIGNLTYDWDYALLIEGRDPTLVSSYSSRTFFRSTSANSLNLSYEELLTLASKNPVSTVLVFASPKNSLPEVSVKNTSGKGCYVDLNSVLKNKLESEKNAADAKAIADKAAADAKAIADKAAADAKAIADKAAADAKAIADKAAADAKAIAEKAAADANRREQLISVLPLRSGIVPLSSTGLPLKVNSTSNLSVFAYNSTNDVCEYQNGIIRTKKSGRCVIAFSQEGNSEFKPAGNLILDFTIAAVTRKTTITCVKGKLTKKVTSLAPQCPAGYKKK